MIGVGVEKHPGRIIEATVDTNLYTAFTAVSNIVFAYCAHVAFFGLIALLGLAWPIAQQLWTRSRPQPA